MTATCRRCEAEMGDQAVICGPCTTALRDALRTLAALLPMLTAVAAKMTARGSRTGTIKRTGHGDGISVHPLDVADEVRAVVTPWVRMLEAEGVITGEHIPERIDNGPADTAALCSHLASRMSLIRVSDLALDLAGDVLDGGASLCLGYNDDGVPDIKPHYPPGEFVLSKRPPLVDLCRQVIDPSNREPRLQDVVPHDRLDEAMRAFVSVKVAWEAARAFDPTFRRSLRTVYAWLSDDSDAVYISRKTMDGERLIMSQTLLELAKNPPTVKARAA